MLTLTEDHKYYIDDRRIPGVTEIIDSAGLVDKSFYTEDGRIRGTYVHRACELHLEGDLYWDGLEPAYRPYLESFARFVDATRPKVIELERLHYSDMYGYAGRPDWVLEIDGQVWLIDGKSGAVAVTTGLQTAAYEHLIDIPCRRAALQLSREGRQARLKPLKDEQDFPDFVHLLGAFNCKLRLKGGWLDE